MSASKFYLLFVVCPNVLELLQTISSLWLFICFIFWFFSDNNDFSRKVMAVSLIPLSFLLLSAVFSPSKRDLAQMYLVDYISNVKSINKLPAAIVNKLLSESGEKA